MVGLTHFDRFTEGFNLHLPDPAHEHLSRPVSRGGSRYPTAFTEKSHIIVSQQRWLQ